MSQSYQSNNVSVGNWIVTYLIMAIPVVGLVMLFVWAFGNNSEPSKSNWAKASLIWMLIGVVLAIVLSALGALSFASLTDFGGMY